MPRPVMISLMTIVCFASGTSCQPTIVNAEGEPDPDCGKINADDSVNLSDAIVLLTWLFVSEENPPVCPPLARCKTQLSESQAALLAAQAERDQALAELASRDARIAELEGQLAQKQQELDTCSGGLADCQTASQDSQAKLASCQADLAGCQTASQECQANLTACQTASADYQSQLASCQTLSQQCQADLTSCQAASADYQSQLASCQTLSQQCQADLTSCQAASQNCQAELTECQIRLAACGIPATGQQKCYDFSGNEIACSSPDYPGQDGFYKATCPSAGRFTDSGDGTITDNCTGLMWQKETAACTCNWQDALKYCENLDFEGHNDWRLPNVRELESLVDYGRAYPAIESIFEVAWSGYWSSTTLAESLGRAWYVNFGNGGIYETSKASVGNVRAVRSAR